MEEFGRKIMLNSGKSMFEVEDSIIKVWYLDFIQIMIFP